MLNAYHSSSSYNVIRQRSDITPSSIFLLAAGGLRPVFTPLTSQFTRMSGIDVKVECGPAGLLCERIEAGEPCALLASANREHPQNLLARNKAVFTHTLCQNKLSLVNNQTGVWLDLLHDPTLQLGTSTPGCGPSGDYTWAFFGDMDALEPGLGRQLRTCAVPLVGGRDTVKIPQGKLASAWILCQGLADLFIGYTHYARAMHEMSDVHYVAILDEHNIRYEYQLAVFDASNEVMALVEFILSRGGQEFLSAAGFIPLNDEQ